MVNTTPGVAGTSTITVMPVNGFTGTVALTTSVSPAGLTCSTTPPSITGGSGTSVLSCSGNGGSYTVVVTGTSGTLSHTANVTFNVQDFTLTASPTTITANTGNPATSSITVQGIGGFTGTVSLSVTTNSTNLTCTLTPTSVTGGSGSSVLSCTSSVTGSYLVTVTGTSGSLSHTATVTDIVTKANQCSTCVPPSLTQLNFKHRLSLSKYSNTQTFKMGAVNNNNVTIYVNFQIVGTDGTGVNGFTLNSGVLTLAPGQNVVNLSLSVFIPSSDVGDTFNWTLSIQWGTTATTDPAQLPNNSFTDVNGIPTSGSFTVLS